MIASMYEAYQNAERAWIVQIAIAFPTVWPRSISDTKRAQGEPGSKLYAAYEGYLDAKTEWERVHASLDPDVRSVMPLHPR